MVSLFAAVHNSYKEQESPANADYLMTLFKKPEFSPFPCLTREDFFEYLLYSGCERTEAFLISEYIRKGYFASGRKICENISIPEDLKKVTQNCTYAIPRAFCIEVLMLRARIAYYSTIDSKTFSKILYNNKKINTRMP